MHASEQFYEVRSHAWAQRRSTAARGRSPACHTAATKSRDDSSARIACIAQRLHGHSDGITTRVWPHEDSMGPVACLRRHQATWTATADAHLHPSRCCLIAAKWPTRRTTCANSHVQDHRPIAQAASTDIPPTPCPLAARSGRRPRTPAAPAAIRFGAEAKAKSAKELIITAESWSLCEKVSSKRNTRSRMATTAQTAPRLGTTPAVRTRTPLCMIVIPLRSVSTGRTR